MSLPSGAVIKHAKIFSAQLVEALAAEIRYPQQAIEFRERLLLRNINTATSDTILLKPFDRHYQIRLHPRKGFG